MLLCPSVCIRILGDNNQGDRYEGIPPIVAGEGLTKTKMNFKNATFHFGTSSEIKGVGGVFLPSPILIF